MVEKDAHIDLVFRNGLKDYEALPPAGLWEEIQPVIKRNRSFLFLRIAATIMILFSLAFLVSLLRKQSASIQSDQLAVSNPVAIQIESNPLVLNNPISVKTSENFLSENVPILSEIESVPELLDYKVFKNANKINELIISSSYDFTDKEISVTESDPIQTLRSTGFTLFERNDQVNLIAAGKPDIDKWMLGALGAPTYYLSYSPDKLNLTTQLQKAEETMITYSGGISFAYSISRKLSIQSGFYYSSIGNKLRGVETYSGFGNYVNTKSHSNFELATTNGMVLTTNNDVYMSDNGGNRISTAYTIDVFDPLKAELQYVNNVVRQSFQYLEVPVIMRYKVLDKKIELNLLGGLSYNLLIGNSVYAVSSGKNVFIGKTEGVNPIAFSSSVGFGMAYDISKKISLNLEPTMRYYLSKTGDRTDGRNHPYLFGVYSGIFYKF